MNEITLTFTIGQLFAVIGAICLVAITIYLVGVLKEVKKTLRQLHETLDTVNEVIEDVQETKLIITRRISEFKKFVDVSKTFKEMKEKFARKKKNKKQGED